MSTSKTFRKNSPDANQPKTPKTYKLQFVPEALEEWNALDGSVKQPLKKLLEKRLQEPRIPGASLGGDLSNCYKIKLRKRGYRLVYEVYDNTVIVLVLSVGKREGDAAYITASQRRGT